MPEATENNDDADQISECVDCSPDDRAAARETMEAVILGDVDGRDVLCSTHYRELERGTQRYALAQAGVDLPADHPWREASVDDRGALTCRDCDVTIALIAADIQAGIRLHCPDCFEEMEWII